MGRKKSFDAFLKRISQATGIDSQTTLAEALGVNRSAISQARKKNAVPAKWLLTLFRSYGLNPDWVEAGTGPTFVKSDHETPCEFVEIPKVKARLCAGGGSFEADAGVEGYYSFQPSWINKKGTTSQMVLMDIFGNSMAPEMKDGDTVLIDQAQKDILSGAIFAVGVEDTIMVKRIEKHPNALVLLSDNKDYAPIYLKSRDVKSIRIIGKIIWICREFK